MNDTTVNGYNQLSNYYNVPASPYYQSGYFSQSANAWVLDAKHFRHQNILVHSFDGSFGSPGTIPANGGTQGQSYMQTFTLTVPTYTNGVYKFNSDNLYIVAFIAEYDTDKYKRNVLNVVKEKVNNNDEAIGIKENENNTVLSLYPNPCNGILYLNSLQLSQKHLVKIYNLLGNKVWDKTIESAGKTEMLDLTGITGGIYIIEINSANASFKEKLIIQGK